MRSGRGPTGVRRRCAAPSLVAGERGTRLRGGRPGGGPALYARARQARGPQSLPPAAALELIPPQFRNPTAIVNLPDRDDPRYDAELLALDVDVYVDYGTVDADYVAALEAISERTRIPGIILDGRLGRDSRRLSRLGAALGVAERGARLADEAERLIDKYRGTLARRAAARLLGVLAERPDAVLRRATAPAKSPSCWARSTWRAASIRRARRPLTVAEIRDLAPDVVVAANPAAAAAIRSDPAWHGGRRCRSGPRTCAARRCRSTGGRGRRPSIAWRDDLDGLRATGAAVRRSLLRRCPLVVRDLLSRHAEHGATACADPGIELGENSVLAMEPFLHVGRVSVREWFVQALDRNASA